MAIPTVKEDKYPSVAGTTPKTSLLVGHDGTNFKMVQVDSSGRIGTNLEMSVGIEIDGTSITNRRIAAASNGNNTILAVGATERLKLYKAILTVESDITGEVILKIGSTEVGGARNPRSGGQYSLMNAFPDFEYGALGDDLVLSLPSATAVTVNASYEVV